MFLFLKSRAMIYNIFFFLIKESSTLLFRFVSKCAILPRGGLFLELRCIMKRFKAIFFLMFFPYCFLSPADGVTGATNYSGTMRQTKEENQNPKKENFLPSSEERSEMAETGASVYPLKPVKKEEIKEDSSKVVEEKIKKNDLPLENREPFSDEFQEKTVETFSNEKKANEILTEAEKPLPDPRTLELVREEALSAVEDEEEILNPPLPTSVRQKRALKKEKRNLLFFSSVEEEKVSIPQTLADFQGQQTIAYSYDTNGLILPGNFKIENQLGEEVYDRIFSYLKKKKYREAIPLLQRLIYYNYAVEESEYLLALVYFKLGDTGSALAYALGLDKKGKRNDLLVKNRELIGEIYYSLQNYLTSYQWFLKAITGEDLGKDVELYHKAGIALWKAGKIQEAKEMWKIRDSFKKRIP